MLPIEAGTSNVERRRDAVRALEEDLLPARMWACTLPAAAAGVHSSVGREPGQISEGSTQDDAPPRQPDDGSEGVVGITLGVDTLVAGIVPGASLSSLSLLSLRGLMPSPAAHGPCSIITTAFPLERDSSRSVGAADAADSVTTAFHTGTSQEPDLLRPKPSATTVLIPRLHPSHIDLSSTPGERLHLFSQLPMLSQARLAVASSFSQQLMLPRHLKPHPLPPLPRGVQAPAPSTTPLPPSSTPLFSRHFLSSTPLDRGSTLHTRCGPCSRTVTAIGTRTGAFAPDNTTRVDAHRDVRTEEFGGLPLLPEPLPPMLQLALPILTREDAAQKDCCMCCEDLMDRAGLFGHLP